MTDRKRYLYRKTVKGHRYLFFRHKGKLTPLPADEDSAEFRRAYDAAMRAIRLATATAAPLPAPSASNARTKFLPGTLGAAIDRYLDSAAYDQLAPSSKAQYLRTLRELRARLGTGRLADLDPDAVDIYCDRVAKECGTSVADRHMRLISKVWKVARKYPEFNLKDRFNPTLNTETYYAVKQRHRPWPRGVQDKFMAGAPDHLKIAKLLLHFSAQRGGDCVRMKWADYDGRGISVRPRKTHGEVDPLPNYHLCPRPLREALDSAPRLANTILVNARGRPYANANVLSHAIKRELVRLGLAKEGERTFVMHGLRKTAASDVGSLGVGAAGIKSVGGWRTDDEANYYAQDADQRRINEMVVGQWDAELERGEAAAGRATVAKARRAAIRAVK
jgi:integrase